MKRRILLTRLATAANLGLDAVFPPRCAGCNAFCRDLFCPTCTQAIAPLSPPYCVVCGLPFDPGALAARTCAHCRSNRYHAAPPYSAIRSLGYFEGPLRHAVHALKYKGLTTYAAPLGHRLSQLFQNDPTLAVCRPDLVIPVPLHPWRRWRRGFNQSELLARQVSRELGVPLADVLQRTRYTLSQVGLGRNERAANIAGAFAVKERWRAACSDKTALLVDDVFTTGSTLEECALALRQAGCAAVYVVTLAREA